MDEVNGDAVVRPPGGKKRHAQIGGPRHPTAPVEGAASSPAKSVHRLSTATIVRRRVEISHVVTRTANLRIQESVVASSKRARRRRRTSRVGPRRSANLLRRAATDS